jgi:hypothetical protein
LIHLFALFEQADWGKRARSNPSPGNILLSEKQDIFMQPLPIKSWLCHDVSRLKGKYHLMRWRRVGKLF